jgi:RimJ/RimL family protein N-acetyltransferase
MYDVIIKPLEEKNAEISWKWRNDPEIWEYTGSRPNIEITPDIEKKWIKNVLLETNSKRFAIIVDDVYVGNVQLTNISRSDAEYHIFIGNKKYWGKGIAYSATKQILTFANKVLKLKSVFLYVNSENVTAIKLYEKIGFKRISKKIKMIYEF